MKIYTLTIFSIIYLLSANSFSFTYTFSPDDAVPGIVIQVDVNLSAEVLRKFETTDWDKKKYPNIKIAHQNKRCEDYVLKQLKENFRSFTIVSKISPCPWNINIHSYLQTAPLTRKGTFILFIPDATDP